MNINNVNRGIQTAYNMTLMNLENLKYKYCKTLQLGCDKNW